MSLMGIIKWERVVMATVFPVVFLLLMIWAGMEGWWLLFIFDSIFFAIWFYNFVMSLIEYWEFDENDNY